VQRKGFTPSELYGICPAVAAQDKANAAQRKAEGQKSGGRGKKKLPGTVPPSLDAGRSSDATAARENSFRNRS
jgi:hypothetical protein